VKPFKNFKKEVLIKKFLFLNIYLALIDF